MTESVVTAPPEASIAEVAGLMRDRNVGSVVICEGGRPVALITDRDGALTIAADGVESSERGGSYGSRPVGTGQLGMDLEGAAAGVDTHRHRRLRLHEGG